MKYLKRFLENSTITKDNFFTSTYSIFDQSDWKINRSPDYHSDSGSVYWFTEIGVYRKSNHWGKVASCKWYLQTKDRLIDNVTNKRLLGFSPWNKFSKI